LSWTNLSRSLRELFCFSSAVADLSWANPLRSLWELFRFSPAVAELSWANLSRSLRELFRFSSGVADLSWAQFLRSLRELFRVSEPRAGAPASMADCGVVREGGSRGPEAESGKMILMGTKQIGGGLHS